MQKILVFWRDIPAQVLVKRGRERGKTILSHRFQAAIDRAAMRAGKGGSDEYLADWRRETITIDSSESPQSLADQMAAEIEMTFSDEDIKLLVKSKGLKVEKKV